MLITCFLCTIKRNKLWLIKIQTTSPRGAAAPCRSHVSLIHLMLGSRLLWWHPIECLSFNFVWGLPLDALAFLGKDRLCWQAPPGSSSDPAAWGQATSMQSGTYSARGMRNRRGCAHLFIHHMLFLSSVFDS